MRSFIAIPGKFFITCILASACSVMVAGVQNSSNGNKKAVPKKGLPYLTCSVGAAVWYASGQTGLSNRSMPLSVSLEYGRTSSPLSIIAGAFFNTSFNYDIFLLKPDNFLAGVQFAPLRGQEIAKNFNIYGIAGLNVGYSRFTDDQYSGIVNYQYKTERKTGVGITAGAGVGYRLKSWEIKPVLFYFTGHSDFYSGHFTGQRYNTGSLQLHLTLNYRIIFNKNNRTCPVYSKFHRL